MSLRVYRFLLLSLLPLLAFAHGDEAHDDGPSADSQLSVSQSDAISGEDALSAGTPVAKADSTHSDASADQTPVRPFADLVSDLSFSDFPTLHPLVVHIPVTLIPIAFLFSVSSLFSGQRIFTWLTLAFTAAGLFGGFLAAFPLHPHTTGLPDAAKLALQKHDFFAYGTLWLTAAAFVVSLFCVWKPARIFRSGLTALLLISTLAVSVTGHYGGTLAYVHGIGVQGQFLSTH